MSEYSKAYQIRGGRQLGKRSRSQVETVRLGVYLRDEHRCVAASSELARLHPCAGGLTIQHARGKGMGGSAMFDEPAWLRTCCIGHNMLFESSADAAAIALLNGWSVPRNAFVDPERVPVRYPDGRWYRLEHAFIQRELVQGAELEQLLAENAHWRER